MANKVISFPAADVRAWTDLERLLVAEIGEKSQSDYVLERLRGDFDLALSINGGANSAGNESLDSVVKKLHISNACLFMALAAAYIEIYRATGGIGKQ